MNTHIFKVVHTFLHIFYFNISFKINSYYWFHFPQNPVVNRLFRGILIIFLFTRKFHGGSNYFVGLIIELHCVKFRYSNVLLVI